MKITGFLTALALFLVLGCGMSCAESDDESMLIEYPDGDYGIDLGGGYQTLPTRGGGQQQELLLPSGYREDYKNTQYGAMTQRGFVIFPSFKFPSTPEDKFRKELQKKEEYVFHEATTTAQNAMMGVSGPRRKAPGTYSGGE